MNAAGHEPEFRSALHRERRTRVMRQNEDGRVIRRLLSPPPLPAVVRPGTSNRTEHVSSEDPGADAGEAPRRHLVVGARFAPLAPVHPLPGLRAKEPVEQLLAADAQRMLEILVRARAESV